MTPKVSPVPRYWKVPASARPSGKDGRTHVVILGSSAHDLAQGTPGRWPWKKPVEPGTHADWVDNACHLCRSALEGQPLNGHV